MTEPPSPRPTPAWQRRLPGHAGRLLAPRLPGAPAGAATAALSLLRGRLRRGARGPGPLRHDPDRQLGRRAGRGRPPPPAARRPAHRRRDLPPGESSSPGPQGRVARHPADRRTATSMPSASAAASASSGSRRGSCADTAGAAADVAKSGDITRAAIASRLAGEIYGLGRSAPTSRTRSTTRPASSSWPRSPRPDPQRARCLTTFIFRVRNVPAALYKALGGFATNGVNMVKLESYLSTAASRRPSSTPTSWATRTALAPPGLEELCFLSRGCEDPGRLPGRPFRQGGGGR